MKKILGIAIAAAIALVGFSVMAEEVKAPAKTDSEKKAEEVCKAKNLTGTAYDDCLKAEAKATTTTTTTTAAAAKTPATTTTTTTAPATK